MKPGTEAPLAGTLMEVISAASPTRLPLIAPAASCPRDAELPYSRGDVQLLADEEGPRDGRAVPPPAQHAGRGGGGGGAVGVRRRWDGGGGGGERVVGDEGDSGGATLHDRPPLAASERRRGGRAAAAAAAVEAAGTAPMAPAVCYRPENWEERGGGGGGAARGGRRRRRRPVRGEPDGARTLEAVAAAEWEVESELEAAEVAEEAAADDEATLVGLELSLGRADAIIRNLSRTGGGRTLPAQLLALMPPPPQAGWPEDSPAGLADEPATLPPRARTRR